MSTTHDGGEEPTSPTNCQNAGEYVLARLTEADKPLRPQELADEYGCGGSHMRHVMADMVDRGLAERVKQGQYVLAEGIDEDRANLNRIGNSTGGSNETTPTTRDYARQHGTLDHKTTDTEQESNGGVATDGGPNHPVEDTDGGQETSSEDTTGHTDDEGVATDDQQNSGGTPLPFPALTTGQMVGIVLLAVVVLAVLAMQTEDDTQPDQTVEDEETQPDEQDQPDEVNLIDGEVV